MTQFLSTNEIRSLFAATLSDMYRDEVPLYGDLIDLVRDVNAQTLEQNPKLHQQLEAAGELGRLDVERHGAIRVGTAAELSMIRRMFAVMGMVPVGYYDLSVAGIPVHSTAFRPIDAAALKQNPFRVFCSLLRLDLVEDRALAATAAQVLSKRQIVTPEAMVQIDRFETAGGLTRTEAEAFVTAALETFRWHAEATVDQATYEQLHAAHRLIADVVSFKGPHINHLTPRTLDIDAVQAEMPKRGIDPKAIVEGPARRTADILLRQTSFKALQEQVSFSGSPGTHTARFGEIEQRGIAVTPKGRALYDDCLSRTRARAKVGPAGESAAAYVAALGEEFERFPDGYTAMRQQGLGYFQYRAVSDQLDVDFASIDALIDGGHLAADPQTYEDFLPVSAAGIFQSNLGSDKQSTYCAAANQAAFEEALGAAVTDADALYAATEAHSLTQALTALGQTHLITAPD
ncbi:DUF1338 family protein [Epibacterium sp. SM1979]|uniref:2-oxoadipate dioxygenase/decarboxylase n=1 Tax=Tritonibacter litoralis TaxID=2662264 RepID=A0A843YJM5_9RHOB|nr:VOC family protein [Tritonibacter litoralis]MQQ09634.1 DUF1338 family protein [Tritonibacter litoralis]